MVRRQYSLYKFSKSNGTFLCEKEFKVVHDFSKGLARVQMRNGRWNCLQPDRTLNKVE